MPDLTLVIDHVDDNMVRVYGRQNKVNWLICVIHVDAVEVLFGRNIADYWYKHNSALREMEIILSADPREEEIEWPELLSA